LADLEISVSYGALAFLQYWPDKARSVQLSKQGIALDFSSSTASSKRSKKTGAD